MWWSLLFDDISYLCLGILILIIIEFSKSFLTCSNFFTCTWCPDFSIKNGTKCYSSDGYYFDENYQIKGKLKL